VNKKGRAEARPREEPKMENWLGLFMGSTLVPSATICGTAANAALINAEHIRAKVVSGHFALGSKLDLYAAICRSLGSGPLINSLRGYLAGGS